MATSRRNLGPVNRGGTFELCRWGVSMGLWGRVGQFTRDVLWEEPEEELECGVIRELGESLEGSEGSVCELVLQT